MQYPWTESEGRAMQVAKHDVNMMHSSDNRWFISGLVVV